MKLQEMKDRFDKEVRSKHIKCDWDGGHCYSFIDSPLTNEIDNLHNNDKITSELIDEFQEYINEWMYEHEPPLYCCPDDGCTEGLDLQDLIDYIEGYLGQKKEMYGKLTEYDKQYTDQLNKLKMELLGDEINTELKQK